MKVTCVALIAVGATLALAAGASAAALPKLTLSVSKNSISVGGQMVSGGVELAITVKGEAEDNPALVRLNPGVTAAQFFAALTHVGQHGDADVIDAYGSFVFNSGDLAAGNTTSYVDLPAGNYLALNSGNAHQTFTVTPSPSPAKLPAPQATLTAIDFGYRGASTLTDGERVRFQNDGALIHMFQAAKVASVHDATLAEAQLRAGNTAGAKKYVIAPLATFAGPLSSTAGQESTVTAPPGVYVIFCAMNTQDGRQHFQLGMYRTVTIVK